MVQASYDLRARQQTSLTPRLQQSVKLLQMSALEFTQEVQQALSNNPFLEDADDEEVNEIVAETEQDIRPEFEMASGLTETADAPSERDTPYEAEDGSSTDSYSDLPEGPADEAYSGDYPTSRATGDGDSDVGQWAKSSMSLRDRLRRDLSSYRLDQRAMLMAEFIIEALDEDGYLRVPLDELVEGNAFEPATTTGEWETTLKLVQQLHTPGLGARTLQECLRLQLQAMDPGTPGRELALIMIETELPRLARHDYNGLERSLRCTPDQLREACGLIRHLDPKPGLRFARDDTSYVVPDVIVTKVQGLWVVAANRAAMPRARLHGTYPALFRGSRYADRTPMAQELQEARWLIRNIEQRYATIQRVAEAIVERQQTFFEYGEVALRPLMLREIADELGIHESTVSRATGNKYMDTPRGIFEFKHFFSRELATETGGTCSASAVRALIKEMIEGEDSNAPLSDVDLARMLGEQGVVVARRTVSKYRGQLKTPPAELRRAY
ncbi:RNA polymerase factor sigma-54 [Alcaligenaceae bacterium B3P038]|nr:RNA polymerase factor sigma-54 [Alcaligenaceae bacterium B3P038]